MAPEKSLLPCLSTEDRGGAERLSIPPSSSSSVQWGISRAPYESFGNVIPPNATPRNRGEQTPSQWKPPPAPTSPEPKLSPPLQPTRPAKKLSPGLFSLERTPRAGSDCPQRAAQAKMMKNETELNRNQSLPAEEPPAEALNEELGRPQQVQNCPANSGQEAQCEFLGQATHFRGNFARQAAMAQKGERIGSLPNITF